MKRTVYFMCMGLVMYMLASCKEDTPLPYDGQTGISFQSVNVFTNTLSSQPVYPSATDTNFVREYFFTYDESPDAYRIFQAPVVALGYTLPFDRPVAVEVASSSTVEPGSYEIATDYCCISGGSIQGMLSVKVNRPSMDGEAVRKLVIKLLPNDYFSYVNGDGQYFTCYVSNVNYKPRYWDVPLGNMMMTDYFGIYSNNKFEFIHQVLSEYEEEDWYTGEVTRPYADYSTLEGFRGILGGRVDFEAVQNVLKNAYEERLSDGEPPIYDENTGKEIVFGY